MRKQTTYGKRSRAIYNPVAASFSSPDQLLPSPVSNKPATTVKDQRSRRRAETLEDENKAQPKVLGERSHNVVALPIEAIEHVEQTTSKPAKSVARDGKTTRADKISGKSKPGRGAAEVEEEQVRNGSGEKVTNHNEEVENHTGQPEPSSTINDGETHRQEKSGSIDKCDLEYLEVEHARDGQNDAHELHCEALLNLSLHPLTSYNTWSSQLSEHFNVTKIAEASFGEVYRLSLRDHLPEFSSTDESVFKIIPLQPPESTLPHDKRKRVAVMKKAEFMSKPNDVANEVKLLQRMSAIPGFTNFRDVRILQGRPPEAFIQAFKNWNTSQKNKKKELSHFPDPSKKYSYTPNQLWAVIEMQDAGTDLERLLEDRSCSRIWDIWDIFWQVVLSLAKGEEGAEFEHRDLHLGNICVHSTSLQTPEAEINPNLNINFTSLETTIIDYTISRCLQPDGTTTAYTDLSTDSALFEGDSTDEYQYDIYRYMRSVLFLDNALADYHSRIPDVEASGRNWEQYHPQTNLVWLHLMLYKLLEQLDWPSTKKAPNRKTKREEHKRWKRANDLEHVLLKVQDLLDPAVICGNGIHSAGDLILLALQESWMNLEDVVGPGVGDETTLVSQLEGLEL